MANAMVQPLDFERILSFAIGDMTIAVYVLLIGFSVMAAKFRMPTSVYGLLMFIFFAIMMISVGNGIILLLGIIIAIGIYVFMSRLMKQ